jgi:flavodoxin
LAINPNLKKLLLIAVAIVVIVILGAFAFMGAIFFDVWSMTAGGSETLNPAGNVTGHALVVYNPGLSGSAKGAADLIAGDLKADGYTVTLAGVKSAVAADVSGYDVIVVGGPIYFGNASSSIKAYLQGLHPSADAKVGVFGDGGSAVDNDDMIAVIDDVASVSAGTFTINAALKLAMADDKNKRCADFVTELLQ